MTDPVAPAVTSFDPVEWTKRINDLECKLSISTSDNGNLRYRLELEAKRVKIAEAAVGSLTNEAKTQRRKIADLQAQLAADPPRQELAALRDEVAAAHRAINRKEDAVKDALIQADVHARRAKEQEAKVAVLVSTLETMQRARDAAQVRESSAYKRVAELERDFEQVKKMSAEFSGIAKNLGNTLDAVEAAHSKGHPAAVAGCALCSALGREVSPAAAPAKVAKS